MAPGAAIFRWLALGMDLTHAALMVLWGVGLPLLFWHRFPKLSRGYMWFAVLFIGVSVASQAWLGECVLTRWSRQLWTAAGGYRDDVPFVVTCVNAVARIRPSSRAAVLAWEAAVALSALGVLWHLRRSGEPGSSRAVRSRPVLRRS